MKCWCGGEVTGSSCRESKYHDPYATGRPKRVSKLYIAGPMTGYPSCNYPAFADAARHLRGAGYDVVDPSEFGGEGTHYVDLLRDDIRAMLDCRGVAVLEGWWESGGARNEVSVAGVLLMPVRPVAEWLERAVQELN